MKLTVFWMSMSLLVHAAVLIVFVMISNRHQNDPVLVIDFSLQSSSVPKPPVQPPPQPQPQKIEHSKRIDNNEVVPDTIEPDTITPAIVINKEVDEGVSVNTDNSPVNIVTSRESTDVHPDSAQQEKEYIAIQYTAIRDIVYRNLSYPLIAKDEGWQGTVKLSFLINRDGSIDSISVIESSGFQILDLNAKKTVKRSAPFPKAPGKIEIRLPVTYKLE